LKKTDFLLVLVAFIENMCQFFTVIMAKWQENEWYFIV